MSWHWIDLVIIGIIILSVVTGLMRGFIKELIALCVWVLAFWVAYHYSYILSPWLQNYITDRSARMAVAFILLLLATLIVGGIANGVLGYALARSGLSGTDRLLGMVFGFIRGVFIVALIIVVIRMTSLPYQEFSQESLLYAKFNPIVEWIYKIMPDFIKRAKQIDSEKNNMNVNQK